MKKLILVIATALSLTQNVFAQTSQLSENADLMNALRSNKNYQALVASERAKEDTGDLGETSTRAILLSVSCGETCTKRYLVLREFFQGHGGANYNMTTLVDTRDNQITSVVSIQLTP